MDWEAPPRDNFFEFRAIVDFTLQSRIFGESGMQNIFSTTVIVFGGSFLFHPFKLVRKSLVVAEKVDLPILNSAVVLALFVYSL